MTSYSITPHPWRTKAYALALKGMFRLSPERIHGIISAALRVLQATPRPVNRLVGKIVQVNDPILSQEVFGTVFPQPLGLAAGFDKNGRLADVWHTIGFGYAELGTVTAAGQPGNPAPRLFRLPKDKAILNRMGFNNEGAADVAFHLRHRKTRAVVGINIGKTKVVDAAAAADDYRRSASLLGDLAQFLVVNVSSPNTPGLRDLQAVESLRPILQAVQEATNTPVLVKIAPDLSDEDVDAVADRALEVLKRLRGRVGDSLVLIGVGGISTPKDAWERIAAGATLVQGYTGLIYGGLDWIRDIHLGIAAQLRAYGLNNISEAVGSNLPWTLD